VNSDHKTSESHLPAKLFHLRAIATARAQQIIYLCETVVGLGLSAWSSRLTPGRAIRTFYKCHCACVFSFDATFKQFVWLVTSSPFDLLEVRIRSAWRVHYE
jgi:hypothetical protein